MVNATAFLDNLKEDLFLHSVPFWVLVVCKFPVIHACSFSNIPLWKQAKAQDFQVIGHKMNKEGRCAIIVTPCPPPKNTHKPFVCTISIVI